MENGGRWINNGDGDLIVIKMMMMMMRMMMMMMMMMMMITLRETNIAPENGRLEVGRLVSFWDGPLSGALAFIFREGNILFLL